MGETEGISSFFGFLAAILFISANAYYPARLIAKNFRPWSKDVTLFFQRYLKAHITLNLAALLAVMVHARYADESNMLLTLCFFCTIWLTVEGLMMHYRVLPGMQAQLRLLHSQQAMFFVWVFLIIMGHSYL